MADDTLDSTVRQPLTIETPTSNTSCRPTCKRPVNGTAVKFTFVCTVFQITLIVMFMALVDYGEHALPTLAAKRGTEEDGNKSQKAAESAQAVNDISLYYPSKC